MRRGRHDNNHTVAATKLDDFTPVVPKGTPILTGRPTDTIRTIELAPHFNFEPHRHETIQLMWPQAGSLRVICHDKSWVLTPGAAAWIPSMAIHDAFAGPQGCIWRSLYLCQSVTQNDPLDQRWLLADPEAAARPFVFPLDRLLQEVIGELDRLQDFDVDERGRLELVMYDRLRRCLAQPE